MPLEMKSLRRESMRTSYGEFAIEINVGATNLPALESEAIREAADKAASMVKKAVMAAIVRSTPEAIERAKEERDQLVGLFNVLVFVEEIPNGYCSDWCCEHKPWFVVTTPQGKFKIGWRKRVIQIEWDGVTNSKTAEAIFANENVTKGERMIHAWSLEDARRYIEIVLKTIG